MSRYKAGITVNDVELLPPLIKEISTAAEDHKIRSGLQENTAFPEDIWAVIRQSAVHSLNENKSADKCAFVLSGWVAPCYLLLPSLLLFAFDILVLCL
ncbi:MAG: hypothetical protein LBJ20_02880 [Candidatus Methanoplasma sp.]|jgi:hypothetical protein|nr:hypothetical protein [Candidatus Methanoplasma sp.]